MKKLTDKEKAHKSASKAKPPPTYNEEERGCYWWGRYEGYLAGLRAGRKEAQ